MKIRSLYIFSVFFLATTLFHPTHANASKSLRCAYDGAFHGRTWKMMKDLEKPVLLKWLRATKDYLGLSDLPNRLYAHSSELYVIHKDNEFALSQGINRSLHYQVERDAARSAIIPTLIATGITIGTYVFLFKAGYLSFSEWNLIDYISFNGPTKLHQLFLLSLKSFSPLLLPPLVYAAVTEGLKFLNLRRNGMQYYRPKMIRALSQRVAMDEATEEAEFELAFDNFLKTHLLPEAFSKDTSAEEANDVVVVRALYRKLLAYVIVHTTKFELLDTLETHIEELRKGSTSDAKRIQKFLEKIRERQEIERLDQLIDPQ